MPQSRLQAPPRPLAEGTIFISSHQRQGEPRVIDLSAIGAMLRQTRETRGASIADAAEALFIKKSTVGAIESGCWETLPHPLYVKGYVRSYASYLGIVEAVETHLQEPSMDGADEERATGRTGFKPSARLFLSSAIAAMAARFREVVDACHVAVSAKRRALNPRF